MPPRSSIIADVPNVPAGSQGVTLQLPDPENLARVAGTVVDRRGNPVTKLEVHVSSEVVRLEWNGSSRGQAVPGASVFTDDEGRFKLAGITPEYCVLSLSGENILPRRYPLDSTMDLANLRITVGRRLRFQVELTDAGLADGLEARNSDGDAIALYRMNWQEQIRLARFPITDGRTEVLAVSDSIATFILFKGDR